MVMQDKMQKKRSTPSSTALAVILPPPQSSKAAEVALTRISHSAMGTVQDENPLRFKGSDGFSFTKFFVVKIEHLSH